MNTQSLLPESKVPMKVIFYGTRGSVPIFRKDSMECGGNTTCLNIQSQCIPKNTTLYVDAGTGIIPGAKEVFNNKSTIVDVLQTHWHHDHTQGLLIAPLIYIPTIQLNVWGPVDRGFTPRKVYKHLMIRPLHPVAFEQVASHFEEHPIKDPASYVIIFHHLGGRVMITKEVYERWTSDNGHIRFKQGRYPVDQCLVITMYASNHPDKTISYRFHEMPTGKIFVFLTDHENTDSMPQALIDHVKNADLLVTDTQYSHAFYQQGSVGGWGHGTPSYAVKLATKAGVKKLGFTHHDPQSSDEKVEAILEEGREYLDKEVKIPHNLSHDDVCICRDYEEHSFPLQVQEQEAILA